MPTFDGVNLLITLDTLVTQVDAKVDLYSDWKEWQMIGDNAKYPPAFRATGGDPLTPGIDAGAYFFIRNDLGWRIKPPEEDITILMTGNLAPEDSSLPIMVPTTGAFTAAVFGLQPVTQSVESLLTLQQESLYQGAVWMDTLDGTPGTAFPVGTASEPVSNVADALTIATLVGVKRLFVRGFMVVPSAMVGWVIEGVSAESGLDFNGQDMSGTIVRAMDVEGSLPPLSQQMSLDECEVESAGVTGWRGHMNRCRVEGDVSLAAGHSTFFKCVSDVADPTAPAIDCGGLLVDVSIRDWVGGLEVKNFSNAGGLISLDLDPGYLILGPTVSAGKIALRGTGKLTDGNTGPAGLLDRDGFIAGEDVLLMRQLVAGDVEVSLDDQTITVYDRGGKAGGVALATFSVSADGRLRLRTG